MRNLPQGASHRKDALTIPIDPRLVRWACAISITAMDNRRDGQSQRTDDGRRKRLASALRANLLRRKKQAQARSGESEVNDQTSGAAPGGLSEPDAAHDSAEIIPDKTIS